jgi:DNA-binding XRE family transcriptional regulator
MKLDKLADASTVRRRTLRTPAVHAEWDRTALARAVALKLTQYRAEHQLSQSALARQLGMKQPAIARLESGDHNPSIETLWKLASGLGVEFHIDVTPKGIAVASSGGHARARRSCGPQL